MFCGKAGAQVKPGRCCHGSFCTIELCLKHIQQQLQAEVPKGSLLSHAQSGPPLLLWAMSCCAQELCLPSPCPFPALNPAWQTQPVSWGSFMAKVEDMACSCRNHSASMAQETLLKLHSPVLKNMRAVTDTILLPSVCSCLGRRQISSPETSCTLLLGDKEENTSSTSSSWPGHRLFLRAVQGLAAELSPCRGCPEFTHAKGEGKILSRATVQPNTHLKGAWTQRGLRGLLTSVGFVESSLQWLLPSPTSGLQLLARTAIHKWGVPQLSIHCARHSSWCLLWVRLWPAPADGI